jgi:hypothetical protein
MSSPASFSQQAIWISRGNSSASTVFNLLWSLTFYDSLDTQLLRDALVNIVTRQAALRSTFRWTGAGLELQTLPDAQVTLCEEPMHISDISLLDKEIEKIGHCFGAEPYDLESGALYRFKLLRISSFQHVLLCGFHHLVIDGTSWKLFVDELSARLGRTRELDTVASYDEYIQWQKCQVNSYQWSQARSHW